MKPPPIRLGYTTMVRRAGFEPASEKTFTLIVPVSFCSSVTDHLRDILLFSVSPELRSDFIHLSTFAVEAVGLEPTTF